MKHRPSTPRVTVQRLNILAGQCKSAAEFGRRIGINNRQRVSDVLLGKRPVYAMDVKAISQVFKVSPSWLLGLNEEIYEEKFGGIEDGN